MKYICICKSEYKTDFAHFQKGVRCMECGIDKQQKNSIHFKDYTFNSGKIIRIQGYEHLALDELVKIYNEEDILTDRNDMPKIYGNAKPENDINKIINNVHNKISIHQDEDSRIETLSISDEEITSIIEDATDVKILKSSTRGRKNNSNRTLNI